MRIGELGQAIGVDIETIRHYEKIGLLSPPAREANGYRNYDAAHVERLATIAKPFSICARRGVREDRPSTGCR